MNAGRVGSGRVDDFVVHDGSGRVTYTTGRVLKRVTRGQL